jgi:hypothetical protein
MRDGGLRKLPAGRDLRQRMLVFALVVFVFLRHLFTLAEESHGNGTDEGQHDQDEAELDEQLGLLGAGEAIVRLDRLEQLREHLPCDVDGGSATEGLVERTQARAGVQPSRPHGYQEERSGDGQPGCVEPPEPIDGVVDRYEQAGGSGVCTEQAECLEIAPLEDMELRVRGLCARATSMRTTTSSSSTVCPRSRAASPLPVMLRGYVRRTSSSRWRANASSN